MAKQITRSQLAGLLRQEGFKEELIPTFIAISQAESGLNPRALNPDTSTGDYSLGLFQINMLGPMGEERRRQFGLKANEELYDPRTNVRAAKAIYDSQGLGAWSVTRGKNPIYEQYLPAAQKAAKTPLPGGTPAMDVASKQPVSPPPPVDQVPEKGKATVDTVLRDPYGISEEANKQDDRRKEALNFLRSRIATNQKDLLGSSEDRLSRQRSDLMSALMNASKPQEFFE